METKLIFNIAFLIGLLLVPVLYVIGMAAKKQSNCFYTQQQNINLKGQGLKAYDFQTNVVVINYKEAK